MKPDASSIQLLDTMSVNRTMFHTHMDKTESRDLREKDHMSSCHFPPNVTDRKKSRLSVRRYSRQSSPADGRFSVKSTSAINSYIWLQPARRRADDRLREDFQGILPSSPADP